MNHEQMENQPQESGEKTFTQDDVNRFVSKRIAEERAKMEGAVNQREQELNRKELLFTAKEKLQEKGIPISLVDVLKFDNAESLDQAILEIEKVFRSKEDEKTINNTIPTIVAGGTGGGGFAGNPIRAAMGLNRK